jgi:hypothetical protein
MWISVRAKENSTGLRLQACAICDGSGFIAAVFRPASFARQHRWRTEVRRHKGNGKFKG